MLAKSRCHGATAEGREGDGYGPPAGVDALQGLALVGVVLGPMVEIDRSPLFDLLDEIGEQVLGCARWGWVPRATPGPKLREHAVS